MTEHRVVRLDMHSHTEYSPDSRMTLRAFADAVAAARLDVIAVTDHDTIEGALILREMDLPFRLIVGEEIASRDGEIIGLFLERPVPPYLSAEETVARIHEQGGLVSVPHPFSRNRRRRIRRAALERVVHQIDTIEIFNARESFGADNRRALAFALQHGLPGAVGSDSHRPSEIGGAYVEIPDFSTPAELIESLRTGTVTGRLSGLRAHLRTRYDVMRRSLRRLLRGQAARR